ncbi:MAG: hypothetical protein ACOC1F_13225, partial [Myxococcota bacterium]
MNEAPLRLLEASGPAFDRGYVQGRSSHGELDAAFESLGELGLTPPWLSRRTVGAGAKAALTCLGAMYLRWHGALLRQHAAGRTWRRLEGIAAGAGVSTSSIYGLHAV